MTVSVRPLLAPGVAMVTAGAIALAPAVVAPSAEITATPGVSVPTVHVENIALTGIGQDIYNAITPLVQGAVAWGQYAVAWVPFIGPPISAQIGINYFGGIQPVIQATVNYAADVLHNPLGFFPITAAYGNTLFTIGYNYVSAQLNFFGLPGLPPIVAATSVAATPARAAASGPADIPAAVKSVIAAGVQARAEIRDAVATARQEVKSAGSKVRAAAATGTPAEVHDAAQQPGNEISSAVKSARSEVRSTARAARAEVRSAVKAAHASVKGSGESAD